MENTPAKSQAQTEASAPAVRRDSAPTTFDVLRRQVDRLFDDFRVGGWPLPFGGLSLADLSWQRPEGWQLAPAMDIVAKPDMYEITAELPGLDDKNVEIKLANGVITIKGEKQEEKEEREKEYYFSERRYGSFQRAFRVPDDVEADKIEAHFKNGVLTVALPKSQTARQNEKRISVKAG